MNPMALLQFKSLWDEFTRRHPKFPAFLKAASQAGLQEGAVLEIQITTPDGKQIASNLKVTQEDLELFKKLQELRN